MIEGSLRAHRSGGEPGRFRGCVAIECSILHISAARPETHADDLMRIGFASNRICTFAFGGFASAKAGHRQIKAAPEEMYRARLAAQAWAEHVEDAICR